MRYDLDIVILSHFSPSFLDDEVERVIFSKVTWF